VNTIVLNYLDLNSLNLIDICFNIIKTKYSYPQTPQTSKRHMDIKGLKALIQIDFLPQARKLLSDWDDLSNSFGQSQRQNQLRIGVVHTLVTQLLPSLLKTLSREKPELQLGLTTGLSHELEKDVLNRKIDCALVTMPENKHAELEAVPLYTQPMTVIAHKNASGKTWRELLQSNPYVRFARHAKVC